MGPVAVANQSTEPSASAIRLLLLGPELHDSDRVLQRLHEAGLEMNATVAASAAEFRGALQGGDFDAALIDSRKYNGELPDIMQALRAAAGDLPLLLLTDLPEEAALAECLKLGTSDYVSRERLTRLPLVVKRAAREHTESVKRARLEEALRESESRARSLTENAVYGIFQAGFDGVFRSANETLQKILACSSFAELQALNLASDVFRYPEGFSQILAECRERGLVQNAETEWRRRDGGFVCVRLHLRVVSGGAAGDFIEGIVEDVTEMRALERQLHQAQKFETIGQLAGGIAHDFNNVLGAVLGWAEIGYEQSRAYPQIADYFAHIKQQADRAAALTRELLTFARRQPLKPRALQINDIISNLMSFLDKVIGKDIEIKVAAGSLQPVKAEPAQIEQVIMNLCINARDAMPDGGMLRIETEMIALDDSFCQFYPGVTSGNYVVLSVSDTGCGMPPDVRDRIFEPFFTTKERGKGSGMGLATVYGIVRQHGGFIHVYSEAGQGTLFHVYLPVMENAVLETAHEPQGTAKAKSLQGPETILLAEDHDSIRELVRQSLTRLGYHVLAAADGKQALRLAELEPPALAVLDVVMPHMGGASTAAELLRRHPSLPILFTSGFSENANTAISQVPGSHYLQKPYSPTSLASTIREILDNG